MNLPAVSALPLFAACAAMTAEPGFASDTAPRRQETPWTILLYGAVDNNAADPFLRFTDRVRRAIDDDPGVELVMFIDRGDEHAKEATYLGDDFTGTRLYRVRKDSVERLSGGTQLPELTTETDVDLNSADASTLRRFVAWGKANFPARRYCLLIYSHADGRAMCPDERARSEMGIAESTDEIGLAERVDLLALELCNMGGIEAAYQWRPGNGGFEADVLVAIPNAGPPLDWDRAFRRIRSPGRVSTDGSAIDPAAMSAADFGRLIVEEGHRGRQLTERPDGRGSRESAGCYDLSKAADVKKAVDALAVALAKTDSKQAVVELRNAPSSSPGGRLMSYTEDGGYVDLHDLCRRMAGSAHFPEPVRLAAIEVMQALAKFVLASFGMSGYRDFEGGRNGVFIVLPSGSPNCWRHYRWYTPTKGEHGFHGNWTFLRDGATAGNGAVENWFELLDAWFGGASGHATGGAVPRPAPDSQAELERLQGRWTMVSMEVRGRVPDEPPPSLRLAIKGHEWIMTSAEEPDRAMRMTVAIDATTDPKSIDMTAIEGGREHVTPGIYRLEGDTLTLRRATAMGDIARPREFATSPDEGMLIVWRRVKE